jgi:hypothetical protein
VKWWWKRESSLAERELRARMDLVGRIVEQRLDEQGDLHPDDRNIELIDAMLDLRAIARPSTPGLDILREDVPSLRSSTGARWLP